MLVKAVPARYRSIVESAIRCAVRDIERDMAQPDARPRHVAAFGVDEQATGDLLVLIVEVPAGEDRGALVGAIAQAEGLDAFPLPLSVRSA